MVASLALGKSYDCFSCREATLGNLGKICWLLITTKHNVQPVCVHDPWDLLYMCHTKFLLPAMILIWIIVITCWCITIQHRPWAFWMISTRCLTRFWSCAMSIRWTPLRDNDYIFYAFFWRVNKIRLGVAAFMNITNVNYSHSVSHSRSIMTSHALSQNYRCHREKSNLIV